MTLTIIITLTLSCILATSSATELDITFRDDAGRLEIFAGGQPFATYVYEDPEILRPYFCHITAPNGFQVTRNHPPDPERDKDNLDHETMHPGLWLAFGDLGGSDFWRNKARVRFVRFEQEPRGGTIGSFSVVNAYETLETPPRLLCEETCTYTITATADEHWIRMTSRFRATASGIAFGDQEEMGLGVRLTGPLTVKHGSGTILNSLGGVDEKGTWGKQADWCSYSGLVEGGRTGMILMTDPGNFRASWFHNRDYGLMVANPFGKKSMTAPKDRNVSEDTTPIPQEEPLTLGFAVCVFSVDSDRHPGYAGLYAQYVANAK